MNARALAILLVGLLLSVAFLGCMQPTGCTKEAKICPDGTAVGRNPALNCEFDPCPEEGANPEDIPMPEGTGEEEELPEMPF